MTDDRALLAILVEERKRTCTESTLSPLEFRKKYGTFNHNEVAVMAAMRRAYQLGKES